MDERQNDLAMGAPESQAAPEVPELPENESAHIPESYTAPVEVYPYIHESCSPSCEESCIPESYTAPIVKADPAPAEEDACIPDGCSTPVEENTQAPEDYTAPVEENTLIPDGYTIPVEEDGYGPQDCTAPAVEDTYGPQGYSIPAEESTQEAPTPEAPKKPKKKLNKKLVLGGIAAALVIALVIVLVSLLGGKPKNYGVYIKDGELTMFVQGMKEPVELSSRLWKDANNSRLYTFHYVLEGLVAVRDNGNLVIYPDKYDSQKGATLYMCNPNKPKQNPVKIDSGVTSMRVTDDGRTMLYFNRDKQSLHVYDLKKEEELFKDKDIVSYYFSDDLTKVCYKTNDGDVYLWTAKTDAVKVAKDASNIYYFHDTDILFVLTEDGEVLRKTSEMEEAEEIAQDVTYIPVAYATGEVYFLRESVVERNLTDYFDDDMAADDAAMTQPKKPSYPSAPKKPYYWNYDVYADYEADLAEYNELYAKYQEEYNKLKSEYDEAMAAYNAKLERDEIRGYLDRVVTATEFSLSYFNGTEEVLITDFAAGYPCSIAYDVPMLAYTAYVPQTVDKPKMSDLEENPWGIVNTVSQNMWDSLYGETQLCIALGAEATVVEGTDPTNVIISRDGTAMYFLDAPFEAFSGRRYTANTDSSAPAAEAPAADYPAADYPASDEEETGEELIPADQREYASLYRISVVDGVVGAPELLDSEVSYVFTPSLGGTAEDLFYYKDVDGDDMTGSLYRNGLLLAEEVRQTGYRVDGDLLLFYTDWDSAERCGTLCALNLAKENAEAIEVGEDVFSFQVTEAGDILFLQDYDRDDYEGTLMLFDMDKGEAVEVDDDILCLLAIQ